MADEHLAPGGSRIPQAGLRIGIDVGGTFTHGVVLAPPGRITATAVHPTTHGHEHGVAEGVRRVLSELVAQIDARYVAMVAHSTTQATNALLEGDVSGVHLAAIAPHGEGAMVRSALADRLLYIGNGHAIRLWPKLLLDWRECTAEHFPAQVPNAAIGGGSHDGTPDPKSAPAGLPGPDGALSTVPEPRDWFSPGWEATGVPEGFKVGAQLPVAVVQPLAGGQELREGTVAAHYRAHGHHAVCASDITQVLGLAARARTACVNASMLPAMVATAEYTARAVDEVLPGVPVQVVRSDGGAMGLSELRRQPISSLLSGPAAGASAALHVTGLANAVFIEVGGTSTDITLIKDGRVRHRYATVGGQRLMVPALDLRTVAVGGGSMLRADLTGFGPRSAHIVPLPYMFRSTSVRGVITAIQQWEEIREGNTYMVARDDEAGHAAVTATDVWLLTESAQAELAAGRFSTPVDLEKYRHSLGPELAAQVKGIYVPVLDKAAGVIASAVRELARAHGVDLSQFQLVAGGGGAPVYGELVARQLGMKHTLIDNYAVISAIGAALAVTCASVSKSVAEPSAGDIAEMTQQVEQRLVAQGSERVSTEFEYDSHRQVLTVTGRGSRPYDTQAQVLDPGGLAARARDALGADGVVVWQGGGVDLWLAERVARRPGHPAVGLALDASGRTLWQGRLKRFVPSSGGDRDSVLSHIIDESTRFTDGGPVLPGLAVLSEGRLIPLDSLGSKELLAEALRWEGLRTDSPACFIVRA